MTTHLCRKCGRTLPLTEFPSGTSPCRDCRAFRQAIWYQNSKARMRKGRTEYCREYRKRNPGYKGRKTPLTRNPAVSKRAKQKWFAQPGNRDKDSARSRAYYAVNRERILARKKTLALSKAAR